MTAEQLTELLLIAGSIVAAILGWKMYQVRRAYQAAIEIEGEIESVTSYTRVVYPTAVTFFKQRVEFELNGRKYDATVDDHDSRQVGDRMTMVVKPDDPWGAQSKTALYNSIREPRSLLAVWLVVWLFRRPLIAWWLDQ